jgi:hypothetical protein
VRHTAEGFLKYLAIDPALRSLMNAREDDER